MTAWERHDTARRPLPRSRRGARHAAAAPRRCPRPAPKPDPASPSRARSASPRSRPWCATLTRSTPSTSWGSTRSIRSRRSPGAAERGTLLHDVLGRFAIDHPKALPAARAGEPPPARRRRVRGHRRGLSRALRRVVAALRAARHRLRRLGRAPPRRARRSPCRAPGRADDPASGRRDASRSGPAPTGSRPAPTAPSPSSISRPASRRAPRRSSPGFSPQLTLEAAMLMAGGFEGIDRARETPELLYVKISGGREPSIPRPIETAEGRRPHRCRKSSREHRGGSSSSSPDTPPARPATCRGRFRNSPADTRTTIIWRASRSGRSRTPTATRASRDPSARGRAPRR